ncbi:hypothetical protein T07_7724 [Trichinella nelsoni]|uniref:Integrase zinc-binding domain-containing protein n=1 Tax=Trichinella nelsoni TaxID=6336 RepID=A0A0V0RG28_9BILA|nr:hypothetical protein T07_7724 [Trichinella nelsoni]
MAKSLEKIWQRFYWPQQREKVEDWCRLCDAYASQKASQLPVPMRRGRRDGRERGREVRSRPDAENFQKWPEEFPMPDMEATAIARHLVNGIFC